MLNLLVVAVVKRSDSVLQTYVAKVVTIFGCKLFVAFCLLYLCRIL